MSAERDRLAFDDRHCAAAAVGVPPSVGRRRLVDRGRRIHAGSRAAADAHADDQPDPHLRVDGRAAGAVVAVRVDEWRARGSVRSAEPAHVHRLRACGFHGGPRSDGMDEYGLGPGRLSAAVPQRTRRHGGDDSVHGVRAVRCRAEPTDPRERPAAEHSPRRRCAARPAVRRMAVHAWRGNAVRSRRGVLRPRRHPDCRPAPWPAGATGADRPERVDAAYPPGAAPALGRCRAADARAVHLRDEPDPGRRRFRLGHRRARPARPRAERLRPTARRTRGRRAHRNR